MEPERTARLPVVGVIGSGNDPHADGAEPLGAWLARLGVHLLTGGGGGVMESVSRAFHRVPDRRGLVIGIIPGSAEGGRLEAHSGYPNRWIEIPIFTHLPLRGTHGAEPMSRNHINVLSSDVIVALPGSAGTASEAALALKYACPLIAYIGHREEIEGLPEGVVVEPDFEKVKRFVRSIIGRT
jgi:uncharacterized protein (TIGR00725 family)